MIFSQYEDSYLIYLAKEHNAKAFKILFEKYQIISNSILRRFDFPDMEKEDLLLDSYTIFLKCIQIYKETNKFYNLYTVSFKRMLIKKKKKIKNCLYLEESMHNTYNFSETPYSIYDIVFENDLQRRIYSLICRGYSYHDISEITGIPIKNVYYQVRKIKDMSKKEQKKVN